jgi:hypothetical protein
VGDRATGPGRLPRADCYGGALAADADTLGALHRANAAAIPFENLDVVLGRSIELEIDHVQDKLAELFCSVFGLCARAGMVAVGVIAIDGTKLHANASQHATRDHERIARQILGEADEIDREQDAQNGQARGDELPPELASREGRERWLRGAKRDLAEVSAAGTVGTGLPAASS